VRTTWKDTNMRDNKHMDISWDDMIDKTSSRKEWRNGSGLYAVHGKD